MKPLDDTESWNTPPPERAPGEQPLWMPACVELDLAGVTHRGCVRPNNEDQFLIARFGRFFECLQSSLAADDLPARHEATGHALLVADGLGGHAAGEMASTSALRILIQLVTETPDWILRVDEPPLLHEVERRAEQRLVQVSQTMSQQAKVRPELRGFGTTLTAVWGLGEKWFMAHLGDSRAYLLRAGKLRQLTSDHTVAQHLADAGLILEEHIPSHPLRNRLTRLLGDHMKHVFPQIRSFTVKDGDTLLLCTDGLTDMVDTATIAQILTANPIAADASGNLIAAALKAGGRDNVTAVVGRLRVSHT